MTAELMILRAVVTAVDDSQGLQRVSVLTRNGVALDAVEVFEPYGLTARLIPGAEGVLLRIGGDRSHPLFICGTDRRVRPRPHDHGEVTVYSDEGDKIEFLRGKILRVTAQTKVVLNCPLVEIPNGDLVVQGISFLQHVHAENDEGGPTGVPQ
jgi:phage baseplate assembly protein V